MAKKTKAADEKPKYRVLRPISWIGERREKGETIEMTDEQAAGIGEEYLVKVEAPAKDEEKADGADVAPSVGGEGDENKEDGNSIEI